MKVTISNESKLGQLSKVKVSSNNNVGRVVFGKVTRSVNATGIATATDLDITGQQDGDVLVYHSNTDSYYIQTLPRIDGGIY